MKILFLCTAHNSLSQRLYLALSISHDVTIEYALTDKVMISAVAAAAPDLVICPFLTTLVPKEIYDNILTLIVHPGPPGDVGPSALDWVLMGDDGSIDSAETLLQHLDSSTCRPGRSHWGVTVLQAIEHFDAGPVWAFDQFPLDIDQQGLTKSELYRGPVTQAALNATLAAVSRIEEVADCATHRTRKPSVSQRKVLDTAACSPLWVPLADFKRLSVTDRMPFQGGKLHHRPLLKATQRNFDVAKHSAQQISRRIRCGDSQPGVLSNVFGPSMYVYGGIIEDDVDGRSTSLIKGTGTRVLGTRNGAVCIATCDGKGVWITHVRTPKTKADKALWPKVMATSGLIELDIATEDQIEAKDWELPEDWSAMDHSTFQEVWVDIDVDENRNRTAYLHFDFYNGAMSTDQCSHLIEAMDFILSQSTTDDPIKAVVLMGGSYFSNGIALNVIEAAADPALESWHNINRINDVVQYLLQRFPARGILTVAAIRGNAAAGGVALATACDFVIAGCNVVLNPAYRAVGLHGSEYHTLSYSARCGAKRAKQILRGMRPLSPVQAQSIGLIDYVFLGTGELLEQRIRYHVSLLLKPGILKQGFWKAKVDTSPANLARVRAAELAEMSKDFWSARSIRYHSRRFDFVRKVKPTQTPLRFAKHRRGTNLDEEEMDRFDDVEYYTKLASQQLESRVRGQIMQEARTLKLAQEANAAVKRRPSLAVVGRQDSGYCDEERETLFAF